MKKLLSLALTLSLLFSLCACAAETPSASTEGTKEDLTSEKLTATVEETAEEPLTDDTTIHMMAMTGPTGMGLAALMHNDTAGEGNKCDYEIELVSAPDQVIPAIANGSCDIAAVPINLSSTLYARTNGQVKVLCANTLGVLHIVEKGESVQSISDLRGKTVYAPNPGSTPEYVLRYVLKENGINPETDLTLEFYSSGDEVATALAANPNAIGMLPEPKVSSFLSENTEWRKALDMTEEWDQVAGEGNTLIQGVFIVRNAFLEEHPALVAAFLDDYNASQSIVTGDLDTGADLVVEAGIIPKAPLAKKAIPGCNITFMEGDKMKTAVSKCLEVLFEAQPSSVGGSLPGDDFYYAR